VCLISSKSAESEQQGPVSREQIQILMLVLEIERLNRVVEGLGKERDDEKGTSEVEFLRRYVESLKT
jgi:hypothetical protein